MPSPNHNRFSSNFRLTLTSNPRSSQWAPAAPSPLRQQIASSNNNAHNTSGAFNQQFNPPPNGSSTTRPRQPNSSNFAVNPSSWLHPDSANMDHGGKPPATTPSTPAPSEPEEPTIISVEQIGRSAISLDDYLRQTVEGRWDLASKPQDFKDALKKARVVKSGRKGLYFLQYDDALPPIPLGSIVVKDSQRPGYLSVQTFGIVYESPLSSRNDPHRGGNGPEVPDLGPVAKDQIGVIVEKLFELEEMSGKGLVIGYCESTIQPLGAWASPHSGEKWQKKAWIDLLCRHKLRLVETLDKQALDVFPNRG